MLGIYMYLKQLAELHKGQIRVMIELNHFTGRKESFSHIPNPIQSHLRKVCSWLHNTSRESMAGSE